MVAFEPIYSFFHAMVARFADEDISNLVIPIHHGVGENARREMFAVSGDRSGAFATGDRESVGIVPIESVLASWSDHFHRQPLLIQINAEGAEYEILKAMLDRDLVKNIPRIQVQFHSVVPDCRVLRARIYERMEATHDMLWQPCPDFDNTWTGWVSR